jgi:hypothetical protein
MVWPGSALSCVHAVAGAQAMEWITYLLISNIINNVLIIFVPQILLKTPKTRGNLSADENFLGRQLYKNGDIDESQRLAARSLL